MRQKQPKFEEILEQNHEKTEILASTYILFTTTYKNTRNFVKSYFYTFYFLEHRGLQPFIIF